ncbi:hypothetical protein ENBRE01_2377 [Enteropsectra breve]|nr:hypothetical protein ENBRE01_2377 [Enteropsectra breve]
MNLANEREEGARRGGCPVTFSGKQGEDPIGFIEDFLQFREIKMMEEQETFFCFKMALTGAARNWLRTVTKDVRFSTLIELFKKRFTPRNLLLSTIYELGDAKRETKESLVEFLDRLKVIANRATLAEDILLAMTLRALPKNLAEHLGLLAEEEGLTWEALYNKCRCWDITGFSESTGSMTAVVMQKAIQI